MSTAATQRPQSLTRPLPFSRHVFRKKAGTFTLYAVLLLVTVVFMFPLVWLLVSTLKTDQEFRSSAVRLFGDALRWQNYTDVLSRRDFLTYAARSFFLALMFAVTNVISSAGAGFAFARLPAPGKRFLFTVVLAMIFIPGIVTVIPQFVLYSRLKLTNTYWPWLLWGLAGTPTQIFLFRQFFAGFPRELEDAAAVDGCNPLRTFFQIFLPNAGPVIAATGIFAFQWVWGDYFFQTLFLNEDHATLAMKLASSFTDPKGNPLYTLTFAAVVLYILPPVVTYFIAQKQIIRGVVTTGLK